MTKYSLAKHLILELTQLGYVRNETTFIKRGIVASHILDKDTHKLTHRIKKQTSLINANKGLECEDVGPYMCEYSWSSKSEYVRITFWYFEEVPDEIYAQISDFSFLIE